jgi:Putative auto-transporter adhesin, head GIN domain
MKKIFSSLFLVSSIAFASNAQQINDANAQKRSVGNFHGIEVSTGVELFLTEGVNEEVAVSASAPEFTEKLITKVENGVLKIYYDSKAGAVNKKKENKNLKAYVSYKNLDKLDVTTGAAVNIKGVLRSQALILKVNTGASAEGEINIVKLTVEQSTGSKVNLSGKAENMNVEASTGSKFTGENITTASCSAKVSTGAKVSVMAEKELQAKASTGGIIKYKGGATIREVKTNTGGAVSRI